jgi:hypothetical protein
VYFHPVTTVEILREALLSKQSQAEDSRQLGLLEVAAAGWTLSEPASQSIKYEDALDMGSEKSVLPCIIISLPNR